MLERKCHKNYNIYNMKLNEINVEKKMWTKLVWGIFCQNYKDWMHHYVFVKFKSTQYSNKIRFSSRKHKFILVQMYFTKCNIIYIQGKAGENWFETGIIEYD